jgi:hypothetical protein
MVSLGKVDQLEIEAEGAAQLISLLDGEAGDLEDRLLDQVFRIVDRAVGLRLPPPNRALPQLLDLGVEVVARLFAEDIAEQGA